MNNSWLPWKEFEKMLIKLFGSKEKAPINELEKVVGALKEQFPDGKTWLESPLEIKKEFRNFHYTELYYIIPWAYNQGVSEGKDVESIKRRFVYLSYLKSRRNNGCNIIVKWAVHFGLLTKEELVAVDRVKAKECRGGSFKIGLAIHALVLMKRFCDFNDEDVAFVNQICKTGSEYNYKSLQDLRIILGYSSVPSKIKRKTVWDELFVYPEWGTIIQGFYTYLVNGDARSSYLQEMSSALKSLLQFLEHKGYRDCSCFKYKDYLELTKFLQRGPKGNRGKKQIVKLIGLIKKFFYWGLGDSFFPVFLEFPEEEWHSLLSESKKEYMAREGLSFSSDQGAEALVKAIYNYKPQNDIEAVVRWFWMIAASSPPRFSYILNLEAGNCLKPMPNEPRAMGLYSPGEDKAGNIYGQFPVLDPMGIEAIKSLEARAAKLNFKPLWNKEARREYIHLFQLPEKPWLLNAHSINRFLRQLKVQISVREKNGDLIKGSAHAFRTYLLTHIAMKTGSIEAVQIAAGHRDERMTRLYLRGKVSRNALLYRVIEKYERGEITGRFYSRLVWLLTADQTPADDMMRALSSELSLEQFLS